MALVLKLYWFYCKYKNVQNFYNLVKFCTFMLLNNIKIVASLDVFNIPERRRCTGSRFLQMEYPFFYFLCTSLVPELCSDIATGTACNIHFILV